MKNLILLAVAALLIGGCAGSSNKRLINHQTGETRDCFPSAATGLVGMALDQQGECVKAYQAQGYVLVDQAAKP